MAAIDGDLVWRSVDDHLTHVDSEGEGSSTPRPSGVRLAVLGAALLALALLVQLAPPGEGRSEGPTVEIPPECSSAVLFGRLRGWIVGEDLVGEIGVAQSGTSPCRIGPDARTALVDGGWREIDTEARSATLQAEATSVTLAPRQTEITDGNRDMLPGQATIRFQWQNWCADAPTLSAIVVDLGSARVRVSAEFPGPAVSPGCADQATRSRIVTMPPRPSVPVPSGTIVLSARLELPPDVRADEPLNYRVVLANPTRVPVFLARCPRYVAALAGTAGATAKSVGELRCSDRLLGPGSSASFELVFPLPHGLPAGRYRMSWRLIDVADAEATTTLDLVSPSSDRTPVLAAGWD